MILFIYRFLINIILLISPIIILFRLIKKRGFKKISRKARIFLKEKIGKKLIWFHGASVGELLSIIPLVENFEKDKNINQILITSSTVSSAKVLNKFKFKKTIHQFFPIDANIISKKFLNFWRPSIAIFIDSEVWPNTILNLNKKKIPIILLNARITHKSFRRWHSIENFGKKIFKCFDYTFPCNRETLNYLRFLGVRNIKFIGNLKFAQKKIKSEKVPIKITKFLKNKVFWCASSTHKGEEEICFDVHQNLKIIHKNIVSIIIPRHVDRKEEIVEIIKNKKVEILLSQLKKIFP